MAGRGPALELQDLVVAHVADHARAIDVEQHPDLLGHGGEHGVRWLSARHQRRHAPQRRLLLREKAARTLGCFGASL